ncbi:hypothetical protein [Paraburkholderia sp. BL25I1N1]|uniref:hypothetical protein n=1 Tax=Paraburkholderia sp. BL25I1N1 TaxID=1938804 RepID=UPI000D4CCEAC|nr:hypothetical protein [Paraburkholderia sp. BL25I1N1]PRX86610.1 hypothetical protein B0G73_1549 [Paraburkholderia sp. BL25I1N1]
MTQFANNIQINSAVAVLGGARSDNVESLRNGWNRAGPPTPDTLCADSTRSYMAKMTMYAQRFAAAQVSGEGRFCHELCAADTLRLSAGSDRRRVLCPVNRNIAADGDSGNAARVCCIGAVKVNDGTVRAGDRLHLEGGPAAFDAGTPAAGGSQ